MPSSRSDADVFGEFVQRVHDRAIVELNLDVQPHQILNTIQWGKFADPHLYRFDPARARKEWIDALVDEALARIRADPP